MHLCEFAEDCNGAPIELDELAHYASMVEDEEELSGAAKQYLLAKNALLDVLEAYNIELG